MPLMMHQLPLTNANEKTDADYSFDLLQGAEDVDEIHCLCLEGGNRLY